MHPRAIKSLLLVALMLLTCATVALAAPAVQMAVQTAVPPALPPATQPATQPAGFIGGTSSGIGSQVRAPIHHSTEGSKSIAHFSDDNVAVAARTSRALDPQRLLLSLAVVIGVIFLTRYAMRKLFPAATVGRSSQVIKVLSRSVLAPKQQFLLLQVGKRLIVVGDSGASMNALAEINDPDEVATLVGQLASEQPTSSVASFASMFRRAGHDFSGADVPPVMAEDRADEDEASPSPKQAMGDPTLSVASNEVSNLLDRVRGLAQHLRRP